MREIKFRGKQLDNGEWVYGSYVAHRTRVGADELRHLIICNEEMSDQYTVNPKSVGQFTGLKDKNGVEAYHEDFIRIASAIYYIQWNDLLAGFRLVWRPKGGGREQTLSPAHIPEGEIIGNVLGNPEMLGSNKP